MTINNLTIFVSSCDAFSDCWDPFFTLFKRHWPEYSGRIILATETKSYTFPGLNIICPCVQNDFSRKLTWSEITTLTLAHLNTPYFLLLLEDYFIKSPVNHREFLKMFEIMQAEDYSHLMLIPMPGKNLPSKYDFLLERAANAPYRFSTQVGIWKTKQFISYLRPHESPWLAEMWGSKRAARIPDSFYALSNDYIETNGYIIDYFIRGGVQKGKWVTGVPEFLQANGFHNIDFSIRGTYSTPVVPPFHQRIRNKLKSFPDEIKSWLSVLFS
jgi:hypothetical protein